MKKIIMLVFVAFLGLGASLAFADEFVNPGITTWTVPETAAEIRVEVWGGGGLGGRGMKTSNHNISGFGGGAGGYAVKTMAVQAGDVYTVVVGHGAQGYTGSGAASGGGHSEFSRNEVVVGAGGGGGGMSAVDGATNSGVAGLSGDSPGGGAGGFNSTYSSDATLIDKYDDLHPLQPGQLLNLLQPFKIFFTAVAQADETIPQFQQSYAGVAGQGGTGHGGDTNLKGSDGGPYSRSGDGKNPYASNGGDASNGGSGGARGRLGRDGNGCCSSSDTKAQDGMAPGGGGGGSDTGSGGFGAPGKVLITITKTVTPVVPPVIPPVIVPQVQCLDTLATNFGAKAACVFRPTVALIATPSWVNLFGDTKLSWSTNHADSCVASGDWSGARAVSGSETQSLLFVDKTFTLTCTGVGGEASDSQKVTAVVIPHKPTITWQSIPTDAVACDAKYTVSARGDSLDGKLFKVSIDKDGAQFAYADGGNGTTNISGNETKDSGPKFVNYVAWSEDVSGNKSNPITARVPISACVGASGCTDPAASNYDSSAKVDNGLCTYASPTATLSVSSSCVAPNANVTFTSNATGHSISSYVIEKDSNQDGLYGNMQDFGATSGSKTYTTSFLAGTYDFRTAVTASNGSTQSTPVRVTVSNTCTPSNPGISVPLWICSLIPALCPPGTNIVPNPPGVVTPQPKCSSLTASSRTTSSGSFAPGASLKYISPAPSAGVPTTVTWTSQSKMQDGPDTLQTSCPGPNDAADGGFFINGDTATTPSDGSSVSVTCSNSKGSSTLTVTFSCPTNNPGVNGVGNGAGGNGPGGNGGVVLPTPDFSISVSPQTVKAKSLRGYSGSTDKTFNISVNPVAGYSAPVTIQAASYPAELMPEFSFDGGATYSDYASNKNPSVAMNLVGGSYKTVGGLVYLPVKIRFLGTLSNTVYPITFKAVGTQKTATVNIDSKPSSPDFREL